MTPETKRAHLRDLLIAGTLNGLGGVLLVGEDNPYGSYPGFALYPRPERAAGNRLRQILGLRERTYLAIHRTNLCTGKWSMREARRRSSLLLAPSVPWLVLVLLGRKVGTAFNFRGGFFSVEERSDFFRLVSLPHPSGRNRMWNEVGAKERARRLLISEAPVVPWGETDIDEGFCRAREDSTHCVHWWDGDAPCCSCGVLGAKEVG